LASSISALEQKFQINALKSKQEKKTSTYPKFSNKGTETCGGIFMNLSIPFTSKLITP